MSMRFIFGDDWNNAKCLSRFSAMAKFFLPCNKSHFFFFNKTGLGLRFMLISHSKPIKSREQNRHNKKYNYTCRRVKWGEHGTCEILVTLPSQHQPHLNPRKSFFIKEHWVEIYSNQRAINYISPSNIRASVETRPPKLYNLLHFSPPSFPDILWASPPRASGSSAIHVFLVKFDLMGIWFGTSRGKN